MSELTNVIIQYGVLIGLMVANVLGGTSLAALKKTFNKDAFYKGVYKVIVLGTMILALVLVGYANQEFEINGMSILEALNLAALAGDGYYGLQVFTKITQIIGLKTVPTKGK